MLSTDYIDLKNFDTNVFVWNLESLIVQATSAAINASDTTPSYSAYRIHLEAKNTAATVHQIVGIIDFAILNNLTKNALSAELVDGVKDSSGSITHNRYYLIVRWIENGIPTPPDLTRFYINDVDPVAPSGIDMSQYYSWLTSADISELRDDGQACLKNISDIIKPDTTTPTQITYRYEDGHTETMYAIALRNTALFGNEYAVALSSTEAEPLLGARTYGAAGGREFFLADSAAFAFHGVKMPGLFTFKNAAGEVLATSDGTYTGEGDETTGHGICPVFGATTSFCFYDSLPHMIYDLTISIERTIDYTKKVNIAYHNDQKVLLTPLVADDFNNLPSGLTITNIDNSFISSLFPDDGPQVNRRIYPAYTVTFKVTSTTGLINNRTYNVTVKKAGVTLNLAIEVMPEQEYIQTSYLNVPFNSTQTQGIRIMFFYCGSGFNRLYLEGSVSYPNASSYRYYQRVSTDTDGCSLKFIKITSSSTTVIYKTVDIIYQWNDINADFTRPENKDVLFSPSSTNGFHVVVAVAESSGNNVTFTKLGAAWVGERQYWDDRTGIHAYLTDNPTYDV